MKLNAILGKGTGKLGGMVLSVNSGEQIVREYNPKVSNPQTDAQVEQRAKFKLLSQIAAALSTSIAFRKMKMQSPRNRFVSANIKNASFENNEASVALDSLDLTGGSQLIPTLSVTRGTGEAITIALSEAAAGDIKRIVYNIYKVTDGSKLQFIKEVLVSEAGAGRTFSVETTAPEADIVVYAYGIKDTTTRSTTKFEEYEASADDNNAVLDVLRALNSTDYVLTATAGEVLPFSGGGDTPRVLKIAPAEVPFGNVPEIEGEQVAWDADFANGFHLQCSAISGNWQMKRGDNLLIQGTPHESQNDVLFDSVQGQANDVIVNNGVVVLTFI